MKHVLFIVTSTDRTGHGNHSAGYEFSEVADPYVAFINQGYTVDFASIQGGAPPYVGFDPDHEVSKTFKEGAGFRRLNFSHKLEQVDIHTYDAIFFPGGLGLMTDMVDNPLVNELVRQAYESDKVIGAVCHGPSALLNVTLSDGTNFLSGKKVNSFTEAEEELDNHILGEVIPFMLDAALIEQGALFSYSKPFESYVVEDHRLVTGQNPASATGVALKMIAIIGDN